MNRHARRAWQHTAKRGHMVQITIQFERRDNGTKATYDRTFPIDPAEVPLLLLEGFQEGNASYMRAAIIELFDLTEAESRQLRQKHVKQISEAIAEAVKVPNG